MSVVNYVCAYFLSPSTWWWSYYTTLQKENHSYNNVHNNNNLNTWIFASNILNNDDDTLLHTGTHPPHSYNQYILSSRFIHIWKSKIFSIFSYFAYIFFRTKEKKTEEKQMICIIHMFSIHFFLLICAFHLMWLETDIMIKCCLNIVWGGGRGLRVVFMCMVIGLERFRAGEIYTLIYDFCNV